MASEDEVIVGGDASAGQRRRAVRTAGRDGVAPSGTSGDADGTSGDGGVLRGRLRRADRRDLRVGGLIIVAIATAICAVNALSNIADIPGVRPVEPWVWEASSLVMLGLLIWIPWLATTLSPPLEDGAGDWRDRGRLALVHGVAVLAYASLHVAGFVALRHLAYGMLDLGPYRFDALGSTPVRFLYELRKDVLSYVAFVAVFAGLAWARRRRDEPVRPVSFDIRDGARIVRAPLGDILAVSSAGNYVEFWLADGRRPLMRATLAAIEVELAAFGFVRAHRSWLVNAGRVTGLRPEGSGDWTVELGVLEAPVSRRYPQALDRLKLP